MKGLLWGLVVVLVVIWGLVKVVFGIAGSLLHLLLVAAVLVLVYYVIRVGASRRT